MEGRGWNGCGHCKTFGFYSEWIGSLWRILSRTRQPWFPLKRVSFWLLWKIVCEYRVEEGVGLDYRSSPSEVIIQLIIYLLYWSENIYRHLNRWRKNEDYQLQPLEWAGAYQTIGFLTINYTWCFRKDELWKLLWPCPMITWDCWIWSDWLIKIIFTGSLSGSAV